MAAKRRKSTKTPSKTTEAEQEYPLDPVAEAAEPRPVRVTIPATPQPEEATMKLSATRFIPVDEPPTSAPLPEKPIVITRSGPAPRPPEPEVERVGDVLRRVRLSRQEELDDIAEYLRIRPSFLAALEESHYEALPADAYVIGFLRTYAVYLGLDGRAAIDQYRREMSGRRNKPQLTMPQPVSEGPAPTVALLVSAALAALLLYALWYTFASADRVEVSTPPPLPQAVSEERPVEDKTITLQPTPTAEPQPEATPPAATTAPAATAAPVTSPPAPAQTPPAPPAQLDKPPAQLDKAPAQLDKAPSQPAKPQAAEPVADEKGIVVTNPAPAAKTAPSAEKAEEDAAPKGKTYGAQPSRARVVIHALNNSWILIADEHGNTVFDKTLKAGEAYYVPTGKNLTLTTGNGKGLQLTLDGAKLPTIGADGNIVRGLSLDAEKIKEKTTSGE